MALTLALLVSCASPSGSADTPGASALSRTASEAPASPSATPSESPSPTPSPTPSVWTLQATLSRADGTPLEASIGVYRETSGFCERWTAGDGSSREQMPEFIVGATGNGAVALETENFGHEDLRFHVVVSGGDDPLRSWWWNGTAWKEHYGQASCGATPYVVYQHLMRTSQLTFSIPEPPACARYKAPMNGPLGASHFEGRAKVLQGPADLGSPMVTLTLEIRIGVITHIRPETTFAAGLSPADLVNTRVFHVLICANSYDPKPPRGFTHQRNGTYVLARVSR